MSRRRISVLHFTNSMVRGGAEEHMLALLRGMDRSLFRLAVACPPELARSLQSDLPEDVDFVALRLRKPHQIGGFLRLGRLLGERQVDILHSHLFYSSLFASPMGWLCRVPVILETPHVAEKWRHGLFKRRFVVDHLISRFVDYYVAVSVANRRYLIDEKGIPEGKVFVIYNGCDLSRFDPSHQAPAGLRAGLGFDEGDPVCVVVGRLEPQKGHRVLLDALQAVRAEFPRVRLVCVGEGSLRDELERRVGELGLEESVRFVGYQSNVPDWLALADVVVLPSFYEGLPIAAIEALAAEKPVVATAVDGTPEVVIDGKTGFTVSAGDAQGLAAALCTLLRTPDLRRCLGRAGRQRALELFGLERQILETEWLYLHAFRTAGRGEELVVVDALAARSGAKP